MDTLERLLAKGQRSRAERILLLALEDPAEVQRLHRAAWDTATGTVGPKVYYRGIIEFSNLCARNCFYCGIRRGNPAVERYWLSREEVLENARWCAGAGFGSVVMQSGERRDRAFADFVADCVSSIRRDTVSAALPRGLGITLSAGEQSLATYRRWVQAGAHRYLLRIESSNPELFARIHPPDQIWQDRVEALGRLKEAGFQLGTGVMIGLPGQDLGHLADDIDFFARMDCDMIGMGPYLASPDTPMAGQDPLSRGDLLRLALNMIALTRLELKDVNIAATTALQALVHDGRERGIRAGANVIMPNLTPVGVRRHYQLYPGKPCMDEGRVECRTCLQGRIESTGREAGWNEWGDSPHARRRQAETGAAPQPAG
jgi:biotin synthase